MRIRAFVAVAGCALLWPAAAAPRSQRVLPPASGCTNPAAAGSSVGTTIAQNGLTPNQLASAYGVTPLARAGYLGQGRRVALIEVGEALDPAGYSSVSTCFGPWPEPVEHVVLDPGNPPTPGGEGLLDPLAVRSVAPKAQIYMIESGSNTSDFTALAPLISAALNPANTGGRRVDAISMSFGACEARWSESRQDEGAVQAALQRASKLGVAVFAAGGDQGSAGWWLDHGNTTCVPHPVDTDPYPKPYQATISGANGFTCLPNNNDPSSIGLRNAPGLHLGIGFPSGSPLVTSVGGTEFVVPSSTGPTGAPSGGQFTEQVWNATVPPGLIVKKCWPPSDLFAGGGGRSLLFKAPPWQRMIGLRGQESKPDIAALAGPPYQLDQGTGTSAASPLTAGAVAVLDGYLSAHHLNPTGPFNPLAYQVASVPALYHRVFNDITQGSNDVLGLGCCSARPGYDEASGLGSLNIANLARVLVAADQFEVARISVSTNGAVSFRLTVPGPGTVNALVTAWKDNVAGSARLLQPALHRFVFARAAGTATRAGKISFAVAPNASGRRLAANPSYPITLRLWVSYTPRLGGTQNNVGYYGLHLGCAANCYSATKHHTGG